MHLHRARAPRHKIAHHHQRETDHRGSEIIEREAPSEAVQSQDASSETSATLEKETVLQDQEPSPDLEKLRTLLGVPDTQKSRFDSELRNLTESIVWKKMQLRDPGLTVSPDFIAQMEEFWRSIVESDLMPKTFASSVDNGLGQALGVKLVEWVWEHSKPSLAKKSEFQTHQGHLNLTVKPDEREQFREIYQKASQALGLETGVLAPSVAFEDGKRRTLTWHGVVIGELGTGDTEAWTDELISILKKNASKLLCVKQVEARLTELWAQYPELRHAYDEAGLKLMTTVTVLRTLLDLGVSIGNLPVIIESLTHRRLSCHRDDLAKIVYNDLKSLGLAKSTGPVSESRSRAATPSAPLEVGVDVLRLELGRGIYTLAEAQDGAPLLERISSLRASFVQETGFIIPGIKVTGCPALAPGECRLLVKELEWTRVTLYPEHLLAIGPSHRLKETRGIETTDPVYGMPAKWCKRDLRPEIEAKGCMVFEPVSVIAMVLTESMRSQAHKLFSTQTFHAYLSSLKGTEPELVKIFLECPRLLKLGKIVLSRLLEERIPIRDQVTILETLMEDESESSAHWATELVREKLGRLITQKRQREDEELYVLTLSREMERLCRNCLKTDAATSRLEPDQNIEMTLRVSMKKSIERIREEGHRETLVTSPELRRPLFDFFHEDIPTLSVLSIKEVPRTTRVRSVEQVERAEVQPFRPARRYPRSRPRLQRFRK